MLLSSDLRTNLFELSPVGYLIINEDGIITLANDKSCTLLGVCKSSLISTSFLSFLQKTELDLFKSSLKQLIQTKNHQCIDIQIEPEIATVTSLELHFDLVSKSESLEILLTLIDVTQRKTREDKQKLEGEISRQNSGYLTLATVSDGIGIWNWNLVDKFLTWDEQMFHLYGISAENFDGAYDSWMSMIHPEDREQFEIEIQETIQGVRSLVSEFRIVLQDRSEKNLVIRGKVFRNAEGQPLKLIGVNYDITKLKSNVKNLVASRNFLSSMLGTIAESIITIDLKGEITFANQSALQNLDYRLNETTGNYFQSVEWKPIYESGNEYQKELLPYYLVLNKQGTIINAEHLFISPSGEKRWFSINASPLYDNTGKMIGVVASFRDITEKILNEKAQIENDRKYKAIFDVNLHGIVYQDSNGKILSANQSALRILNLTMDQILGVTSFDPMWHTVRKDGSSFPAEEHPAVLALKNGNSSAAIMGVYIKETEDYRWIDIEAVPIFREHETKPYLVYTIFKDITAAQHNVKILENFKEGFDAHSIIAITDTKGVILYVNDTFCNISKYSREELIGNTHKIVNSGFHSKDFFKNLWQTIKNKGVWKGEIRNQAKDGSYYWVSTTIIPMINDLGQIYQYLSIRFDITSHIEAQNALAESRVFLQESKEKADLANKAKSDFLAIMSHEIRTPLNGVIGFVDLLLETELSPLQRSYLNIVQSSSKTLSSLLNNTLDLSKIEAGKMELLEEPCNLSTLVKEALDATVFRAREKNLDLLVHIDPKIPLDILTDATRLRQILVNLVNNAIKFTETGSVTIKLEFVNSNLNRNDITIRFMVIDTGLGIADENQIKIFEAFSQEDASTTRKYGGTGLGLSISNQLLNLMNSKLLLESKVGSGSTFSFEITFNLPEVQNQIFSNDSSKSNSIESNASNKYRNLGNSLKILIVDDDKVNLFLATSILLQIYPEAKLFEAYHGRMAIEFFKKERPDIIFMDIQMPTMNGLEASIEIRKLKEGKNVPIIALTAGIVNDDISNCFKAGMNDFASKPIVKSDFETIFKKYFGNDSINDLELLQGSEKNQTTHPINLILLKQRLGMPDETISKIISSAIHSFESSLSNLKLALQEKNFIRLGEILHKINGTSKSICCDKLSSLTQKQDLDFDLLSNHSFGAQFLTNLEQEIKDLKEFLKFS